jgi:hypothetical protein
VRESVFVADGDLLVPTEHARGPWDPRALHGGAPAALIAATFERMQPGGELPIASMRFEFLRPIPMAPLKLATRMTRPGRRVQALAAEIEAGGEVVCRASALRIVPVPPELPGAALEQPPQAAPAPARTLLHPGGIGWAESVLHDERGAVGRARQALVVQPR